MPCRDVELTPAEINSLNAERQARLDFLTSKLCALLEMITSNNPNWDIDYMKWFIDNDTDLSDWWEEHRQLDARRKAAEAAANRVAAIKRVALAKLTPEEKNLLGLK